MARMIGRYFFANIDHPDRPNTARQNASPARSAVLDDLL
jgi:hypothetical protein